MSIHIGAEKGDVAPTVLVPGDPLRARFFAETFLEDASCFNEVRGMLGFTGTHRGRRVSVMGSGMGMPTLSIYLNELFTDFGVTTVIRVGTCGALREGIELGDIILPMTSSTNSHVNKLRFGGMDYAPAADFELLRGAYDFARSRTDRVHVGSIFSSDTFYNDDPDWWRPWSEFGSLACEMETNALYTLAAKFGCRALSVLTVSDSIVTGEEATAEQRERGYPLMAEIALAVAP